MPDEKMTLEERLLNPQWVQGPSLNSDAVLDKHPALEAMREAAQSLMQMNGYKPYSHEALLAFLIKEKLLPEQHIKSLDRYRILRNKSVYEAYKVSGETLKEALEFAKICIPEVKKKLLESTSP